MNIMLIVTVMMKENILVGKKAARKPCTNQLKFNQFKFKIKSLSNGNFMSDVGSFMFFLLHEQIIVFIF